MCKNNPKTKRKTSVGKAGVIRIGPKESILPRPTVLHLDAQEVPHLDLRDIVHDVFIVEEAGVLDVSGTGLGVCVGLLMLVSLTMKAG